MAKSKEREADVRTNESENETTVPLISVFFPDYNVTIKAVSREEAERMLNERFKTSNE